MPSSPTDTVRAWLDALNRQDADALVALTDPDVEIVGPRGTVRGAEVLRDWLLRADLRLDSRRWFVNGRAVVVEHRGSWRLPDGTVSTSDVASRFVIERERIRLYERFDGVEAALQAAGLSEADQIDAL